MKNALFLDHNSADKLVRELQEFCESINPSLSCNSCAADDFQKNKCSQVTHDSLEAVFIEVYEHFIEEEDFMKRSGLCKTAKSKCEEHKRQHAEIVEGMRKLIERTSELSNADLIKALNLEIINKLMRHLESIDFEFHAFQHQWLKSA